MLTNSEGHILPLDELDDNEEYTLTLEDGVYLHNIPIGKKVGQLGIR